MAHHYTEEENKIWLASLPKKVIGVKAIIKNDKGNILLVKPNYKDTWQFPGGCVESHEDPIEAVIREVNEEIGIKMNISNLKLLDTIFKRDDDNLNLIYEYTLLINESDKLNIQEEELEGYQFCELQNVKNFLGSHYGEFLERYTNNLLS